ncbi:DeoR/GlpR family DNA-binding transcription regulator [Paenibacillus aurantius]|uniref:DeoR/GlpR family DNA-binding transcription regulator n=1 Tax=Paenibacillus aurantius TaxID=2918900 RepID=A0AA96LG84_9BACL|nr:DeoR/GlpR family DNA-binding transcription regulator [Paenibacillus aurantius]WNQ11401.1 DeoR/GlpR family DNA-binding transcription regulator [Paenibacillus aurantius]
MLAAERKYQIAAYVKQHRVASVAELAQQFNVHEATIRRDLEAMVQTGQVKRTHGGVTIDQWTHSEPSFSERALRELDQKVRIGRAAAELVEDGDHILIDSGTTTLHMAKYLVHRSNITVVTNDMNIAGELREAPGIKVIVTGGELYPSSYMLNGMFTDQVLDSLHVHKAFIGIPVIHPKYGLMHPEAKLVPAKQAMLRAAGRIIVLADDTKIGKISLHTVAPVDALHTLVTGTEAGEAEVKPFRDSGLEVIQV